MAPAAISPPQFEHTITPLRDALTSEATPLPIRFRALFSLKHYASLKPPETTTVPAIKAIAAAFSTPSALLKHELAYCLGQSGNMEAVPYLRSVLQNKTEDSMCRHEAAEALGALDDDGSLHLLKDLAKDEKEPVVVRETCEIAADRIEWSHSERCRAETLKCSDFVSVDPAPPFAQEVNHLGIEQLRRVLLDANKSLFERYRAMFALRDLASPPDLPTAIPAVEALADGFTDRSALLRHEVAFVFGQLSHPASIPSLVRTLSDKNEASMVRHEAAEALGSLGEEEGVEEVLKQFLDDEEQVVRESIVVALDMAEHERTHQPEYAAIPVGEVAG